MTLLTPPPTTAATYFPTFSLPAWFEGDAALRALLLDLFHQPFGDIDVGAQRPVEEAFDAVLDALAEPTDPERTHRRYVAMGLILALASQAWIRKYTPTDTRAAALTGAVRRWLETGEPVNGPVGEDLYPLVATRHQHLDEDRAVHRHLSRMPTEVGNARQLLLDILDVTIAGFAIHPGADAARRDLFHWWLCQVVPAAYMERLPDHVYSGDWPWPPRGG